MRALIYQSTATQPFDATALDDLVARSVRKNLRLEITGFLHFRSADRAFLQYLEGSARSLEELMSAIRADGRHTIERALAWEEDERVFPDWSMRRLTNRLLEGVTMEDLAEQVMKSLAIGVYDEPSAIQRVNAIVRRFGAARRRTLGAG